MKEFRSKGESLTRTIIVLSVILGLGCVLYYAPVLLLEFLVVTGVIFLIVICLILTEDK
jgi:hypothetical protein